MDGLLEADRTGRIRVLVMDDEDIVRTVVCRMLEHLGYDAVAANEGQEAIGTYERAQREGRPFSLAILDMTVAGGLGGAATLAELKRLDPQVRAVASTGHDSSVGAEAGRLGFAGILLKPYDATELAEVVARLAGQA